MRTEKAQTSARGREEKEDKKENVSARIRRDLRGKNRAEPLVPPSERRRTKEALRESKRGQRKRAQVMVLSCWCHRQIQAVQPPGCHLHLTQYPLYSRYHASLFRCGRLPWCSRLNAPFSLSSRQLPPVTPPLFPPSAVPSPHKLYCQHCFVYLFFFLLPNLGTRSLFLARALFASHPRSFLQCFATAETLEPFQERGTLPTQKPASKFSSRPFFFFLHAIVICRGPIGHVDWFEYYCQSRFSIDDERVKSCHNANLMIVPC